MRVRHFTALISAPVIALALTASPAAASPPAKASGEELLTYLTTGKLKVGDQIDFQVACAADCSLTASLEIVIPGPNVRLPQLAGTFAAFTPIEVFVDINRPARQAIRKNIKKVKLRTELSATNIVTGEVDTDSNIFALKK